MNDEQMADNDRVYKSLARKRFMARAFPGYGAAALLLSKTRDPNDAREMLVLAEQWLDACGPDERVGAVRDILRGIVAVKVA